MQERERGRRRDDLPPTRPRVCQLEHYYTPSATQEEENIETTAFLLYVFSDISLSLSPSLPLSFTAPFYSTYLFLACPLLSSFPLLSLLVDLPAFSVYSFPPPPLLSPPVRGDSAALPL